MDRKRTTTLLGVLGILGAACLIWALWRSPRDEAVPTPETPPPQITALRPKPDPDLRSPRISEAEFFGNEFSFFGQVVESESRQPVGGAAVRIRVFQGMDLPDDLLQLELVSDPAGRFRIEGETGGTLDVRVTKPGYGRPRAGDPPQFKQFVVTPHMPGERASDTSPEAPALFSLRKVNPNPNAMPIEEKYHKMPEGESQMSVPIAGDFSVSLTYWTKYNPDWPRNGWAWGVQLEFVGGGVTERGDLEFIAPQSGYERRLELGHPAETDIQIWRSSWEGSLFFKTDSGGFGRIEMRVGGKNGLMVVGGWYSPDGSRNLEVADD